MGPFSKKRGASAFAAFNAPVAFYLPKPKSAPKSRKHMTTRPERFGLTLIEAMACGTPVVASAVWGTPEVVAAPEAGVLMPSLDATGVALGVDRLFSALPRRIDTRRYAEGFDWNATTQGQLALFREILARSRAPQLGPVNPGRWAKSS
jgi:glycosyltransferase involved in cell wall biosynthesis